MSSNNTKIILSELEQYCIATGFSLSTCELQILCGYLDLLVQWNRQMNLVGPISWQTIFSTLIIDSLHLAKFMQSLNLTQSPTCWDLGSGAGLPGIPLRIIWQKGIYWLIEAREKRALFLKTILARQLLPCTYVYHGRVEAFVAEYNEQEKAEVIISRAFMPWPSLFNFVTKTLAFHGILILLLNEVIPKNVYNGWRKEAVYAYTVDKNERFFIALKTNNGPI